MLIFKNRNQYHIFIHIPKNSGKYIREKIISSPNNKIIKSYWGSDNALDLDLAHIPYNKRNKFVSRKILYHYFAYTRNPYDRIISAFFFLNPTKSVDNFIFFCKNELIHLNFHLDFDKNYIHYYPQYLFLCDEKYQINNIKVGKLEDHKNLRPKKYLLKDYFDEECMEIINKIYEKDFLLFDYEMISSVY
jgi:hypothetical protein